MTKPVDVGGRWMSVRGRNASELAQSLHAHAGAGPGDSIPDKGDPAHGESRHTGSGAVRRLFGFSSEEEFPNAPAPQG
jgi:hypothetical protein